MTLARQVRSARMWYTGYKLMLFNGHRCVPYAMQRTSLK